MFVHGSWNAICDRCGKKYKSHQLRMEWTGLRTCCGSDTHNCWEPRHPQMDIRGKADRQAPPWVKSEQPDEIQPTVTRDDY
jgi:hypothetical protein